MTLDVLGCKQRDRKTTLDVLGCKQRNRGDNYDNGYVRL